MADASPRENGSDAPGPRRADPAGPSADALLAAAHSLQPELVGLRRAIHAEPEIGLENPATREKILSALEGLGLDVTLHARTSGVVATLRGEGGASGDAGARPRRILLRGDTDALPMPEQTGLPFASRHADRMHACGHDAHVAMLVGAARLLAAERAGLPGDVVFMFQPGEESYGGARVMLEEGMPACDGAFALHVAPQIPTGRIGSRPGAIFAAFDDFEIDVTGRGGHASMPHDCLDPVPIACEIVAAIQTFVTRRIPVTDPGVVTVGQIHGGSANNVIADGVRLEGTMRSLSDRTRALLVDGLPRLVEGIAAAHGAEARVRLEPGYPVVSNDPDFEAFARTVATELLGERAVIDLPAPLMGAEDFAYVLDRHPGAMMLLGVRPPDTSDPAPCHSSRMQLDEQAIGLGAALHAAVATRFLNDPGPRPTPC